MNLFTRIDVGLYFNSAGYIGLPYWPERNQIIDIGKDVSPRLGPQKREAAFNAALKERGLTVADYDKLQLRADRPFYTASDTDDGSGEIVIPERILQSFLNNASQTVPKVIPRIAAKGLTFIGVRIEGGCLRTGLTRADAKPFGRFVKMDESNQRLWCESQFIADFIAKGYLLLDETIIKSEDLRKLMEYAGRYIGIGSARPQGYGRFSVSKWDILSQPKKAEKPKKEEVKA